MNQSNVSLVLSADTSAFSASIRAAEQDFSTRFRQMGSASKLQSNRIRDNFNGMSGGAERFSSSLKQAAKQLTVLGGVATGIGLLGKRMLDVADSTAKTADKLGMTTDSLQELRFAASQAGVPTQKLEASLAQFTKRIGEAANGTGTAAATYRELGISVLNADGSFRSSESVLNDVADALAGMQSQSERAAVATALFGREGATMNLLLGQGAKGLDQYRKQSQVLGIVIDESLLRNSEKAADQLDILAAIIKAQVVSAFVQLAPSVINFSQRVIGAIPSIKSFIAQLVEMKDSFIFLGKVVIGIKLATFAEGMIILSRAFIVAAASGAGFLSSITLLSKALKGIGIGLAIGTLVEGLSLLKAQLDIKRNVEDFVNAQQSLINTNQQSASVARLSLEQFQQLSKEEQLSYQERLKAAQQFWQARLNLESRKDFKSQAALVAAKENRLYLENLKEIAQIFSQRSSLEKSHVTLVNSIRNEETTKLKQNISEQLKTYDEANNKLSSIKEKRKTIAKEFKDLVDEINAPPKKAAEDFTVLDIVSAQDAARAALKSGDTDQAFKAVNQAKEVIQTIAQTGTITKSYLTDQANATAQIADNVVQAEIKKQEAVLLSIREKITQIKADAEFLKHLSVAFDEEDAIQSADAIRNLIQERLAHNPIKIPTVVIPADKSADARVDKILTPQKKARGGLILGPGTSMSDSILARLSRGEFVMRASAVKHYGLGLLSRINQLSLPKFATGGLVPPSAPVLNTPSVSASTHQVATLTLNLGSDRFAVRTQDVDVVRELTKAMAREALKSGRRV